MSPAEETVRIAIAALLTGVTLPLIVQLFVTARSVRRAAESVERRLDETLREVRDLASDLRRTTTAAPTSLANVVATATPAIVAAVRAFRGSMQAAPHSETTPTNNHEKENRS